MTDFGTDTLCLDSLKTGRRVSGTRRLGQRCYHRLITPRGTLRGGADEGNFGIDLAGMVGSSTTAAVRSALPGRIENELKKDPQVLTVTTSVVWTSTPAGEWMAEIDINIKSALGPFELVMAVDRVSAKLLKLVA